MSYRGSIAIVVAEKHINNFWKIVSDDIKEEIDVKFVNGFYISYNSSWSIMNIDVKIIMDFLENLPDEEFGYIYIGEDLIDVEMMGIPSNFNLYYTRLIDTSELIVEE
jgi:hypothetical protein